MSTGCPDGKYNFKETAPSLLPEFLKININPHDDGTSNPKWYNKDSDAPDCPWGQPLHFDVTWPQCWKSLDYLWVFLGEFVNVVLLFILATHIFDIVKAYKSKEHKIPENASPAEREKKNQENKEILRRRTLRWIESGMTALLVGLSAILNEFVLKKLISQPRPGAMTEDTAMDSNGVIAKISGQIQKGERGACSLHKGMPSSHSSLCAGFITLFLLRLLRFYCCGRNKQTSLEKNSLEKPESTPRDSKEESGNKNESSDRNCLKRYCLKILNAIKRRWLLWKKMIVVLGLAFVPYSRYALQDHSKSQVLIGSAVGLGFALIVFVIEVLLPNPVDKIKVLIDKCCARSDKSKNTNVDNNMELAKYFV